MLAMSHRQPESPSQSMGDGEQARKTAIRGHCMLPVPQLLVHCTSVGITAAVLKLVAQDVFFADATSANVNMFVNIFQIAAKTPEILIIAFVTAVVLYFTSLGLLR
jgi:hypothetical protein